MTRLSGITVGQLIDRLKGHNPDDEIIFGSADDRIAFNRVKNRGSGIVQIEFSMFAADVEIDEHETIEILRQFVEASEQVADDADRLSRRLEVTTKTTNFAMEAVVKLHALVPPERQAEAARIIQDAADAIKLLRDIDSRLEKDHV